MGKNTITIVASFVCGAIFATVSISAIGAQERRTETRELFHGDLGDWCPGKEVVVTVQANTVGNGAKHFHAAHLFAYILEGSQTVNPDGRPSFIARAGDLMHEAPFQVSMTRTTEPTRVVAVRIQEKGAPATTPVP